MLIRQPAGNLAGRFERRRAARNWRRPGTVERQLFSNIWLKCPHAQPFRAMELFAEHQALRDSWIIREESSQELWTVAFAASMKKHNMRRRPATAIQNPLNCIQRLIIGQMPIAAHDALLDEIWTSTFNLHARLVI